MCRHVRLFVQVNLLHKSIAVIIKKLFNPAQLFIGSFIILILFGTVLIRLPISLKTAITGVDALFIATSAVCVTGLASVDIPSTFSVWGQFFILLLIQAGGIGILSFAGLFAYFLKGGSSYSNQLAIGSFSNVDRLGEVFTILKRTIIITFSIEAIGAAAIYWSFLQNPAGVPVENPLFTAIFHAVSSFCNAGFSTFTGGLMADAVQYNYGFQTVVAFIYIFGGLGFPIVINVLKYLKHLSNRLLKKWTLKQNYYRPWVMTINSKINLITTGIISFLAIVFIYWLEYDNVLQEHAGVGKWVIAMATATTPRTAGFNSIDFSQLHNPSIILIMFLMWIGASPSSTGGGIKTGTFAVAILNVVSLARGKSKTEVFRREIASISIQRAFATMFLSLVAIGTAMVAITYCDERFSTLEIAFECFSAYSTVGLSLSVTPELSTASKLVLICLMFVGRVTMLSVLIAFVKKVRFTHYKYAPEELTIY
ncbi:TrkH family potassium uptake protein [Sphingobacterium griseoflavum]|uniref:Potassium transporter n=1 Tax=Sphingobacterium griseoflavum TaxID=1474952 RepID=A0ABQ3HXH8_9SPHI|nr:potassium transporter TrkG [Sphingobacterium griseoflavum]GHE33969.1 potassium transporter [Sphingobacterium griseoflavum]